MSQDSLSSLKETIHQRERRHAAIGDSEAVSICLMVGVHMGWRNSYLRDKGGWYSGSYCHARSVQVSRHLRGSSGCVLPWRMCVLSASLAISPGPDMASALALRWAEEEEEHSAHVSRNTAGCRPLSHNDRSRIAYLCPAEPPSPKAVTTTLTASAPRLLLIRRLVA